MPSNTPKPVEQLRRRNKAVPKSALPSEGRADVPPEPIEALDELERSYFVWAWSTPAAHAWHDSDVEIVAELARLKAYATRCLRGEIMKVTAAGMTIPMDLSTGVLTQITSREDRLLLSPQARARGHVKIVESEPERAGNVVTNDRTGAAV